MMFKKGAVAFPRPLWRTRLRWGPVGRRGGGAAPLEMKGLEHDAGKAHILAGGHLHALLERSEAVAHDAHLVPPGGDRETGYGRVPGQAAVDVDLTPRRRPDERAPRGPDGRAR